MTEDIAPSKLPDGGELPFDVLDRYVIGLATDADRRAIDAWTGAVPGRAERLERLTRSVQRADAQYCDTTAVSQRLWATVESSAQGERLGRRLGRHSLRQVLWSASAGVAAALVLVLMSYKTHNDSAVTRTYTTQSGQQATFTLTDGTRVTLAPRTTLRLVYFGTSARTVVLSGQAYFEVAQSAGTPFLVRTGDVVTQVLGTAFLVRHYADDERVHVAVAEGKVSIVSESSRQRHRSSPVTLTEGHVGDITDSTVFVNTVNDLTPETDWLRGRLVFRHASVGEVLRTLSQWYGYQFRCSDSVMTQKSVTLALNARSSAEALSTLEQILRVHLTIVGDTVTLTPHRNRAVKGSPRNQVYDVWVPTREVGR